MPQPAASPTIACEDLWKVYGPDPAGFLARHGGRPEPGAFAAEGYVGACRGLTFAAAAGEILVVMGLSGSGKSTLVRCLSRLIEPTAGTVRFNGEDITRASEERLIAIRRRSMGMVFQHFGLLPHRTALRNVSFPLEVQGVPAATAQARARELLSLVGLGGREGTFPHELSGGQQQRVGIARSLAADPELWLLDEPFSALDPLIRREMQDEFLRLQRMLEKTIVFITHDFDEAVRVATRVAILRDGALVQVGTPEDLVTSPADGYVAAFTRTAPRARLISVGRAMRPLLGGEALSAAGALPASSTIEEAAPRVLGSDAPTLVVDGEGRPVGRITRQEVIEVLFQDGWSGR